MDASYVFLAILVSIPTVFAIAATQTPRSSPKVAAWNFACGIALLVAICVSYQHSEEFIAFTYVELEKFWAFRAYTLGVCFGAGGSITMNVLESAYDALTQQRPVEKK